MHNYCIINFAYNTLINVILAIYYLTEGVILYFVPRSLRTVKNIDEKVVLITGGGGGLGSCLALGLAKLGATVVIWDINESGLDSTCKEVDALGGKISAYYCDITDRRAVYETAKKVRAEVGCVDILINNAGVTNGKDLLDTRDEKIVETFGVNVISNFWLYKAFLPAMIERNRGHIVSIASISGLVGVPGLTDYSATKFAVIGLQESLNLELIRNGCTGVKSTIVCPYFIDTGLFDGVRSPVLPMLSADYVADEIIFAIQTDQSLLVVPKLFYLACALKSVLPESAFYHVLQIFGTNQMISDGFRGKNGVLNNNNNNNNNNNINSNNSFKEIISKQH